MPKVVMITTSADADGIQHAGSVQDVSKKEAAELIEGGFARALTANEEETATASEQATGRRGRSKAVSGPDENS